MPLFVIRRPRRFALALRIFAPDALLAVCALALVSRFAYNSSLFNPRLTTRARCSRNLEACLACSAKESAHFGWLASLCRSLNHISPLRHTSSTTTSRNPQ